MWKELIDLVRQVLKLTEDAQQTKTELKELQREVRDLARKAEREAIETRFAFAQQIQTLESQMERQRDEIRRLYEDLQTAREREDLSRRLWLAEIENRLLKEQRRLPASEVEAEKPDEQSE